MAISWRDKLFAFGLVALVAVVCAWQNAHTLLPGRSPLQPIFELDNWIRAVEEGPRAYFRRELAIPFKPRHAWIAVSADDYQLYVNGHLVGGNAYVINPTNAFQNQLLADEQRLTSKNVISMARGIELQKRINYERQVAQFYDISTVLQPGKNVIAIYSQSDGHHEIAVTGEVVGATVKEKVSLPGEARFWRARHYSENQNAVSWRDLDFDDVHWPWAIEAETDLSIIYSALPKEIWTTLPTSLRMQGLPGHRQVEWRLPLQISFSQTLDGQYAAWARILSNYPVEVFIDNAQVGTVSANTYTGFDFRRHLWPSSGHLRLIVNAPIGDTGDPVAWIKVDGAIGDQLLAGHQDWQMKLPFALTEQSTQTWQAPIQDISVHSRIPFELMLPQMADTRFVQRFLFLVNFWLAGLYLFFYLLRHQVDRLPLLMGLAFGGTLILCTELMRIRFVESDSFLYFLAPERQSLWLFLPPLLLTAGVMTFHTERFHLRGRLPQLHAYLPQHAPTLWLFVIAALGMWLRVYNIGLEDLQADENVSWDAARGIMKSGVPEAVSGVWYTRSPLYHYMLAGWLALLGDNIVNARLFAALPGVGSIVVVYLLTRMISGNRLLGLFAAFLIAIDPWQLHVSRIIRFYQLMQFFGLLATYFFIRGIVWRQGKEFQNWFFVCAVAAVLSQEVFVVIFPAYGIAYLIYYRTFSWREDRNLWVGFVVGMAIALFDVALFSILCLTPHVGVGTSSGSIMQLHLLNVTGFINTFLGGYNRAHLLYSLIVFAGLFYWIKQKNKAILTLYLAVVLTLITITILIMQIALRYLYIIYPYLIILTVMTLAAFVQYGLNYFSRFSDNSLLARRWIMVMSSTLFLAACVNLEIPKIVDSYQVGRNLGHMSALQYIEQYRQPGDKVVSVHPMPAAIVFGGIDYYLMELVQFDEIYLKDNRLIDRWAGGQLVSKPDHLRQLFHRHSRLWIILDEPEADKTTERFKQMILQSGEVRFEFFGGKVALWDQSRGTLATMPDWGGSVDSY